MEELKKLKTVEESNLVEWTEEYKKMVVEYDCPKCDWEPDCEDDVIAYGPKIYSYHLSLLSSLPQYTWCEIYKCPNCGTLFKSEAESI
jgi:predicted RNA-binding Zn-ribbon protein involved in translation (DUF1610 family)